MESENQVILVARCILQRVFLVVGHDELPFIVCQ
jgi:hypothetical protein